MPAVTVSVVFVPFFCKAQATVLVPAPVCSTLMFEKVKASRSFVCRLLFEVEVSVSCPPTAQYRVALAVPATSASAAVCNMKKLPEVVTWSIAHEVQVVALVVSVPAILVVFHRSLTDIVSTLVVSSQVPTPPAPDGIDRVSEPAAVFLRLANVVVAVFAFAVIVHCRYFIVAAFNIFV